MVVDHFPTTRNELSRKAKRAQAELARRELARRHLIDFCQYVDPDAAHEYGAPHLRLIAHYIEQAEAGTLWDDVPGAGKRILMITCPPGHWKSSLVSRKLPAWFIGRRHLQKRPYQVILSSYNAKLATAHNSRNLDLIRSKRYRNVFPNIQLSKRNQSSEEWSLEGAPYVGCVARGVGGGLTGYHGAMAIVDDPIKDRKDANSPTIRESLWDWWKDVLRSRLIDVGFILGIWTRWTEDDPMGRILKDVAEGNNEDRVVLLRLPALAETYAERKSAQSMGLPFDKQDPLGRQPGEALWPEKESVAEHIATRKAYPLTFDSLYQGRPRPAGGFVASRAQFKLLPSMPKKNVRWLWGTDWAITEKESAPKKRDPDYTVAALVGVWRPKDGQDLRLVIGFIRRGQLNPHGALALVKSTVLSVDRRYPIRSGQANMDKTYLFPMRRDSDLLNFSIRNLAKKEFAGDKMTKAQPWLEMAHAGQVYVVQGAWNNDFFDEVERFPHGAHDDQIDAVSVAVHSLGLARQSRKVSSAEVKGFGR